MEAMCILGDQLFPKKYLKKFKVFPLFMKEDLGLAKRYKIHKQKILLFFSAMRHYRDELREEGQVLHYELFDPASKKTYEESLLLFLKKNKVKTLHLFEVADQFMEERLSKFAKKEKVTLCFHPSPMFLSSRENFQNYLKGKKKPFMKSFYERERNRLDVLMEEGSPVGGQYSFDQENRKKIPKGYKVPKPFLLERDSVDEEVRQLVEKSFSDHIGETSSFFYPTTRKQALSQLNDFFERRMKGFGPYQDAILPEDGLLHHSLISTSLNIGLLTPDEVIQKAEAHLKHNSEDLASVEGFVRQIMGWREFVRGVYMNYSLQMEESNFWKSSRKMKACWYKGTTGLPPLDDTIKRAVKTSYSHHIERLMILANTMNLVGLHPKEVYKWFMEMYADSSDWVMAANVYGMGLMSDGGIFATKPYVSGSNYIIKMSSYKKGPWCDIWDGLYWRFVETHSDFFGKNPRMRMMVKTLERMKPERKNLIFSEAEKFIHQVSSDS